ncbi:Na(+), Li(+), K(+)/H(+) antiporter subunit A [Candidatus Magnetaquicoccaceae bacterium FCR-1]|uniref:Na(+), Li(+), K(+)/H(+) antiporter subunit A n=1 Tax=Candidatus Magnetaquiglobus chichijimensis TaxID=3141448 RepID=A0ABQ0C7X3_9PROT
MLRIFNWLFSRIKEAGRDFMPVVIVVAVFQYGLIRQPIPNLEEILLGAALVLVGLALFVEGLKIGLFPIGEAMAYNFARRNSLPWLLAFAFGLGFSTTVAEPALIAVADEAARVASGAGLLPPGQQGMEEYAFGMRIAVALSVGFAIAVGALRIIKGWPVQYLIIGGYIVVMIVTAMAPREIIGIAYDSGGITTSTITVPLVTALGIGLANSIRGRNPMIDGFGLIAFASLTPMIFVMAYGVIVFGIQ